MILLSSNGTIRQDDTANAVFSGPISGSGSLLKTGAGELILSGSNTYQGGTIVSAGTLAVTNHNALPNGSSLTVGAGAGQLFAAPEAGGLVPNTQPLAAAPGVTAHRSGTGDLGVVERGRNRCGRSLATKEDASRRSAPQSCFRVRGQKRLRGRAVQRDQVVTPPRPTLH